MSASISITEPRQVLPGGYLSWRDPTTKQWYQLQRFTKVPKFVTLGAKQDSGSLRAWIDRQTNAARSELGLGTSKQQLRAFASVRSASEKATRASASQLRRQIKTLVERHRRVAAARPKG